MNEIISQAKYKKHEIKPLHKSEKKKIYNPLRADNAKPTSTSERPDIRTNMLLTSYKLKPEKKNTI